METALRNEIRQLHKKLEAKVKSLWSVLSILLWSLEVKTATMVLNMLLDSIQTMPYSYVASILPQRQEIYSIAIMPAKVDT